MTAKFVIEKCTGTTLDDLFSSGELDWYSEYADGSDAGKGILAADWNHFPRLAASDSHRTTEGKEAQEYNWGPKGRRFQHILEQLGYKLEWSDQTYGCSHCNGLIHSDDGSQYAILDECEMVCASCIRKDFTEEYLKSLEDSPRKGMNISGIDPAKFGYHKLEGGFESGFHPGQTDSPVKISNKLEAKGYSGILFTIDYCSQFSIGFNVWAKGLPNMTALQQWVECGASL